MKNIIFLVSFLISVIGYSNDFTLNSYNYMNLENSYTLSSNSAYMMSMSGGKYRPSSGKYSQSRKNLKGCIIGTFVVLAVDGIVLGFSNVSNKGDWNQGEDWYGNQNPFYITSAVGVGLIWTWYIVLGSKK
jgi:hypothetical protein